jgi:protein SCO1/2
MTPKVAALTSFSLTALLGAGILAFLFLYEPPKPMPKYGTAPSFTLTDHRNQAFNTDTLKGKVWVADFFFSVCGGPCPAMAANMKRVQDAFEDRQDVELVSITVYPEYDTPDILAEYAKKKRANDRWHFLTGEEETLIDISVNGFMIGNPDKLIDHSTKFVLVDREGNIRGFYEGTDEAAMEILIKDMNRLLEQPFNQT